MRSGAVRVFGALAAVGVVALLILAATSRTDLAFTLGVDPWRPIADLAPKQEVCQTPIDVPADFDQVVFFPSHGGDPTELTVHVDDAESGRTLARSEPLRDYPSNQLVAVDVPRVEEGRRVAVCVRNTGRLGAAIVGNDALSTRANTAEVGGKPVEADITLEFRRAEPVSRLAQAGEIATRAGRFKGFLGAWAVWLAAALVLLAVPALVVRALRTPDAEVPDAPSEPGALPAQDAPAALEPGRD